MEITSEIQHGRYGRPQRVKHLIHHFFRTLHCPWWMRELSDSRQYCIFAWKIMETTSEIQHGRYGRPQRVKHLIHHFFRTLHCGWWLRELSISRQSCFFCMEITSEIQHGRYGRPQRVKHLIHHFFRTLHCGWWLRELSISRQSCFFCMEITSEIQHGRYGRPQRVKHLIHHFFRTLHSGWWLRELSISRQSCIFAWKPLAKYNTADTDGLNVSNT